MVGDTMFAKLTLLYTIYTLLVVVKHSNREDVPIIIAINNIFSEIVISKMYGIFKSFADYSNPFYFILIVLCLVGHIQCEITKCCPFGSVLETSGYFCTENETNWDSYNIIPATLPDCERTVTKVFQKKETYIELNGCIDKDVNNDFVAVSCSNYSEIGVHAMKKCCPIGQSYDHKRRACVENAYSHSDFKTLFQNTSVVFENIIPNCTDDEVFVEYFSTIHDIQFSGENVQVNNDTLTADKFCIEDLINIDSWGTQQNGQHMIIRSCRPRSICNEITCIRRCCRTDQIMLNRPRRCAPHPDNINLIPIFYDINEPLTSKQQQTRLTGMTFC